ncbi:MAG: ferredoxin--NADP reductase [Acidimicrobiales bacterium]|nr:ferredoxin--NADP reductase [Acidimicrobiales bacterium]
MNAAAHRDHGFHTLRLARVVAETADAATFVLDVPADLADAFAYRAGQFCTFRVPVDGAPLLRCYSMSSAPGVDAELAVTVKRVPGGAVSNWMIDRLAAGDEVEVTLPAGVFCLADDPAAATRDVVAYAGGSGITPVFSIVKVALATTGRRVRLLYANRDADSVIFRAALDELVAAHPDRLTVQFHHDDESGYLDEAAVGAFTAGVGDADHYVCGPTPFMDLVERVAVADGVPADRFHIERFTASSVLAATVGGGPAAAGPSTASTTGADGTTATEPGGPAGGRAAGEVDGGPPAGAERTASTGTPGTDAGPGEEASANDEPDATMVTIELDGRTETVRHHPGTTVLQTARQAGLSPPFSCEAGSCATCMAKVHEGAVTMFTNNALTDDEVAEGWVLTCQSVPTTPTLSVVYGYD